MSIVTLNAEKKKIIDDAENKVAAQAWFDEQVAKGFTSASGIKLGLAESDVSLLTGNFVLAKEAESLGLDIPPVISPDRTVHTLSLSDLTALMLEYGQFRANLSAQYAAFESDTEE
jgi:hypothetical protein